MLITQLFNIISFVTSYLKLNCLLCDINYIIVSLIVNYYFNFNPIGENLIYENNHFIMIINLLYIKYNFNIENY